MSEDTEKKASVALLLALLLFLKKASKSDGPYGPTKRFAQDEPTGSGGSSSGGGNETSGGGNGGDGGEAASFSSFTLATDPQDNAVIAEPTATREREDSRVRAPQTRTHPKEDDAPARPVAPAAPAPRRRERDVPPSAPVSTPTPTVNPPSAPEYRAPPARETKDDAAPEAAKPAPKAAPVMEPTASDSGAKEPTAGPSRAVAPPPARTTRDDTAPEAATPPPASTTASSVTPPVAPTRAPSESSSAGGSAPAPGTDANEASLTATEDPARTARPVRRDPFIAVLPPTAPAPSRIDAPTPTPRVMGSTSAPAPRADTGPLTVVPGITGPRVAIKGTEGVPILPGGLGSTGAAAPAVGQAVATTIRAIVPGPVAATVGGALARGSQAVEIAAEPVARGLGAAGAIGALIERAIDRPKPPVQGPQTGIPASIAKPEPRAPFTTVEATQRAAASQKENGPHLPSGGLPAPGLSAGYANYPGSNVVFVTRQEYDAIQLEKKRKEQQSLFNRYK